MDKAAGCPRARCREVRGGVEARREASPHAPGSDCSGVVRPRERGQVLIEARDLDKKRQAFV